MKKILVKIISMILTFTIMLSIFMIAPASVSAATQAENLITIARNEVASASANGGYVGSYNKYNDWADISGLSWCAAFVCWCADQAGISTDIIYKSNRCSVIKKWYEDRALFYYSPYYGGSYIPKAGDLVIFDWDSVADGDHIGIVTGTSGNYLSTIEGNTSNSSYDSDCLLERTQRISLGSRYILGYCTPAYTDSSVTPTDVYNPDNYPFPTRDIYYNSSSVMTGSDVKWIQAVLYQLGYSISVDGSFGPASETVVRQFQSDYGLAVDGSVGPATRQKLYDLWTTKSFQACDIGTDFYAYIINSYAWKHLTNDGNNVSMRSETGANNQIWKFERQSDGSYKIINSADGNILDVANAGTTDGTNVQVCASNDSNAQRWFITGESGAYYLRAKCGNLVLDVNGGSTEDGTNLQMWTKNDSTAQKFQVWKLNKPGSTYVSYSVGVAYTPISIWWNPTSDTTKYDVKIWKGTLWEGDAYKILWGETDTSCELILPPGYYEAYVDSRNNYSMTMSQNIIRFTVEEGNAVNLGDNFYAYITNTANGLYLSNDYYNVSAKSPTYLTEQIWKFERQSDNSYVIRSSSDDTYLDVSNAIAANSTNVQTCGYSGSDAQKWYLIQAGDNKYVIRSKLGNYVLDLAGGSNVSGTNIQIYEPNGTEAQYFSIYKYDTPAKTNVNVEVDGTSVRVNWDKVTGCARYDVHLLQSPWGWGDIKYSKQIDYTMNYCEFKNVAPGDYAAFVVTKPNDNSTQSTWVNFTIKSNDLVPDNQIVHNGHIYSLYNDIMTWDEAKAQCENMGGHLVTVTSEEEQAVIEELVKNQFCKWYFMGATKIENGVDYKWITGEAFDYTNWKNETYDNIYENYLMATTNLNGAWQDTTVDGYSCLVGFICEVETEQISPVKIDCFNGHTYELYDKVLTWEDAEEFAKLKGGYLTAVTTEKEKDFIYDLSQNGEQYYYWLGGKGDNVNDYSWSNNEAFDYSNWAEGEPNNSNSIEHYLMQYKNSSEWNDTTNYQYLTGFVIEYDANTDSGTTGDCTWVFNIDTGELTISGDGNMDDYTTKSSVPWYSYRTDIKSVVFKDGVKNIGDMAFASCSNLTDVTLSDSVASIGNKSFLSCSSLANISSLKNIEIIEENAFTYCDTLENLEFSNNIHYIGSGAFTYTGWYDNQSDGMVYIGTILYKYKGTCPDEVIITDGTTSITATAFSNRTTLKSVVVPDSINAIPNEAFLGCSNLVNVELSKNISRIGSYAFRGCTSLTEITIPRNVTSIGEKALGYYSSDGGYAIVENFTICGYTETIAETYANENGIEFVDLEAEILLGDVNLNGIIDIKDVTEIQKYIAGTNNVNRNEFASADVNSDGIVNVMDATLIQKYCASLITEF